MEMLVRKMKYLMLLTYLCYIRPRIIRSTSYRLCDSRFSCSSETKLQDIKYDMLRNEINYATIMILKSYEYTGRTAIKIKEHKNKIEEHIKNLKCLWIISLKLDAI